MSDRLSSGDTAAASSMPGIALGKGLLIVFSILAIPGHIGMYVASDVLAAHTTTASSHDATGTSGAAIAERVSAIRLNAIIGVTICVGLIALAIAIDSRPLPALVAASAIYFGYVASAATVLPWMPATPWRWPWLIGLTVVAVGLAVAVVRATLAGQRQATAAVPVRAYGVFYVNYVIVLMTPVTSFGIVTASGPGLRDPIDFLVLAAINAMIVGAVVLCGIFIARLPRRQPTPDSRKAWTFAPLAVFVLVGWAWGYQRLLASLAPELIDATSGRDQAHLLAGWILVGCVLPALAEEWLFRRLALATLTSLMTVPLAIVVSSVVFATAHVYSPLNVPTLFLLGIILGWAHITTGRLLLPVLLHFGFNFAVLTIFVS